MKILLLLITIFIILIMVFYFINYMFKIFGGKWRTFTTTDDDVKSKLFYYLMNIFYFGTKEFTKSYVENQFSGFMSINNKGKNSINEPKNEKLKWVLRELICFDNMLIKYALEQNIKEEILEQEKKKIKTDNSNDKDKIKALIKELKSKSSIANANINAKTTERMKPENIGQEIKNYQDDIRISRNCIPSYISFLIALASINDEDHVYILPFTSQYEDPKYVKRLPYKLSKPIPFHSIFEIYVVRYNKRDKNKIYPVHFKSINEIDKTDVKSIDINDIPEKNKYILKLWNNRENIQRQKNFSDNGTDVDLKAICCLEELILFGDDIYNNLKDYYTPICFTNKTNENTHEKNDLKKINLCTMFTLMPKIEMLSEEYLGNKENMKKYVRYLLDFSQTLHKNNIIFCDWKIEQFGIHHVMHDGIYHDKIVCVDTGLNRMNEWKLFNAIPKTYLKGRSVYYDLTYISINETGTNTVRNYIYDEFLLFIDLYNTLCNSSDTKAFYMNKYNKFIQTVSTSFYNATKYIYSKYASLNENTKINISFVFVNDLLRRFPSTSDKDEIEIYNRLRERIIYFQCLVWLITEHTEEEIKESNIQFENENDKDKVAILTKQGHVKYEDGTNDDTLCKIHKAINTKRKTENDSNGNKLGIFKHISEMVYSFIRTRDETQNIINNYIGTITLKYRQIHYNTVFADFKVSINFNNITKINVVLQNEYVKFGSCCTVHPIHNL